MNLKQFRKTNNLTQGKLAEMLGVDRSFIAQIENGYRPMPREYIQTLMDNESLDTSMLAERPDELSILRTENEFLKAQLAEAKAEKQRYWELIQRLTDSGLRVSTNGQ